MSMYKFRQKSMYKFSFKHLSDENVRMKICRADYICPQWFTEDQKKLLSRILDPNPKKVIALELLNVIYDFQILTNKMMYVFFLLFHHHSEWLYQRL